MMQRNALPAWQKLADHARGMMDKHLRDLVDHDGEDRHQFNIAIDAGTGSDALTLSYGLQRVTQETMTLLLDLAESCSVEDERARMVRGDHLNISEDRAVMHMALRAQYGCLSDRYPLPILDSVGAILARIEACVDKVRQGTWMGFRDRPIRRVVALGIGGSDLGPRFVADALLPIGVPSALIDIRFVSNADAVDLSRALTGCTADETLFIIASKTFTTQETMMNAHRARTWMVQHGLVDTPDNIARHFLAVTAAPDKAKDFGLKDEAIFPMWEWVGGRFSLWASVGLAAAMAIGMTAFRDLLRGAAMADTHFVQAPMDKNMPIIWGLLSVWNRNFMGFSTQAVLPYGERLRELPRYIQQIEMESNGKSVTRHGDRVGYATAPVILGERGTVGQHGFHQAFHQGTDITPVDFFGVATDDMHAPENHRALMAHMVAQAGAMAFGQDGVSSVARHEGNRPSNIIRLQRLDAFHLGLMLATIEHKVFVEGIIWGVNSFDQPGVELGKVIARGLEKGDPATHPYVTHLYHMMGG